MVLRFTNRRHAGRALAIKLRTYAGRRDVQVLALPRGGLPVAAEVARELRLPLGVCPVRKLGVPGHEGLAMGAIAASNVRVLNAALIHELDIPSALVERITERERTELERRTQLYGRIVAAPSVRGNVILLIDDGLATGGSMMAAVQAMQAQGAAEVIAAVPVGARDSCNSVARVADACVCIQLPEPFGGIGAWYEEFPPLTDEEALTLLRASVPSTAGARA